MEKKVLDYIKKYSMIDRKDKILVALSGGPDSLCLLNILNNLKEELGIELYAAHLNHGLRGEEADGDEAFVKEFCNKLAIECYTRKVDINRVSKEKGISSEMAGREERYTFFNELKDKLKIDKIALAHNANDQAETILMRIMRGTGIEGLKGIKPVRDNIYIRPILILKRDDIEDYCIKSALNPRIDKTNSETIYTRNKIRLELIPYIQQNFNSDIINTLNRFSELVAKDEEYIDSIAKEKFLAYCSRKDENTLIISNRAFKEQEAILTRILRMSLNNLTGTLYNLERVHIYDIINIQLQGTGKKINLPFGVLAENVYGDIILKICNNTSEDCKEDMFYQFKIKDLPLDQLQKGVYFSLEEINSKFHLKLLKDVSKKDLKGDISTKYFDYDKIKGDMIIRNRKEGDRFFPYGMKGSKKLKDIFIDLKVPREKRDYIPLLCFGDDICWIIGYRSSEIFKVGTDTKNILKIRFERGEK